MQAVAGFAGDANANRRRSLLQEATAWFYVGRRPVADVGEIVGRDSQEPREPASHLTRSGPCSVAGPGPKLAPRRVAGA